MSDIAADHIQARSLTLVDDQGRPYLQAHGNAVTSGLWITNPNAPSRALGLVTQGRATFLGIYGDSKSVPDVALVDDDGACRLQFAYGQNSISIPISELRELVKAHNAAQ